MSQTATPNPVRKGKPVTYAISVKNNGPDAASGVSLKDTLPASLGFSSVKTTQGTCTRSAQVVTCAVGSTPRHRP